MPPLSPISKPRPNLFIIGAMKSGTSALHTYLAKHPQVFMSTPKEPMYFSREPSPARAEDWYLGLFASAGEATVIGESSTEYSKAPMFSGVPQRIAEFNPEARFIYIMRDPVERTISQYWHMVRYHGETRGMLTAMLYDASYLDVSYYAMQLAPYFELFGRDRVFTLTFEEMKTNAAAAVRSLFEWLGVDSSIPLQSLEKKHVTPRYMSQERRWGIPAAVRHTNFWKAIKPLVPRPIRSVGRMLSQKEVDKASMSAQTVVEFLRPTQLEQTQELRKMLNRDFPEWTTLYGATSLPDGIRREASDFRSNAAHDEG